MFKKSEAKAKARALKSERMRRAMALPNVLPIERWDLF